MVFIPEAKPFVKWVGGKGGLLTQLTPLFPDSFGTYFEPFVGGGAVLFGIQPSRAVVNDINPMLVELYVNVRDNVGVLSERLKELEVEYLSASYEGKSEMYYRSRVRFNDPRTVGVERSALFVFINKTCFNGLFRMNRDGKFNAAWGKHVAPTIFDETVLKADSTVLQSVQILKGSFVDAVSSAVAGDFVYFDPPYHPVSGTANFVKYVKERFGESEQELLRDLVDQLTAKGVNVVVSNSDTVFVRNLYKNYKMKVISAGRNVNSDVSKRGKVNELVIVNF